MFLWSLLVVLATMVILNLTRLFLVFKVLNFQDGGQYGGGRGVADDDDDAGHHGYPQPYRTLFALSSSIVFLQRNSDIANKACQLRKKNLNNKVAERSSIQRFITLAFALLATS